MFKKYPFVKQNSSKDCGVAAIQMIIKYYNGYINSNEISQISKTDKNGTTAYHIIETLKYYGFEACGLKGEFKNISENSILLPCIAHVIINESFKHYIVIYEINFAKKLITIGDPAIGIKKISVDEFLKIWTNVFIVCKPLKKIPNYYQNNSKTVFIFNLIKCHQKYLFQIILLSLFITGFSIITSFYFKFIIDAIGFSTSKSYLLLVFIVFLSLYIINIITNYFRNKLLIYINEHIDFDITSETFKQIINLPYRYYCNRTTGDIVSRIADLELIRNMISKIAITLFVDLFLVLFVTFFLYLINSTLFFISFIMFVLYILLLFIFKPLLLKNINNCQENKAQVTSYMIESISNYETVKGLNIEESVNLKFKNKYLKLLSKIHQLDYLYNIQITIRNLINDVGFAIILFVGSLLVIDNKLSIGGLLTYNSLLIYFLDPIKNIIDLDNNINNAKNALKRILELYYNEVNNGMINNDLEGNITFKNLSYSYNDRDLVLENINLDIKNKEKVLIIGGSGSGKSTILKLLMKYYPVKRDTVLLDNLEINDYNNSVIKKSITYISQDEHLFTDTLYNNIVLDREIDSNEFTKIVNMCYINEFIKDNNLGFNMLIEENGFNLSGGQKQRIILARSLLKPFNILLIDEGLNQIDKNLERKILKNIFKSFNDKTIIIVSHRYNNIDLFDKVIELQDGKLKDVRCKNG